jgi:RNA polymerase sigma factor (sigma-70 family)
VDARDLIFRQDAGRMVATLTRIFGVHNLALVEDVVQDAFCRALEVWKFRGVPDNPSAWLMTTARNRALDVLRSQRTARKFAPGLTYLLESEWTLAPVVDECFAADAVKDDLLRMMFSCCHPRLCEEARVVLMLNILCGFSVDEVANAFVSKNAAVEKRINRAKKVLAGSRQLFDVGMPADFAARLPSVLRTLYLLFNEGYHGASRETAIRSELCHEAMRLIVVLLGHPSGCAPATHALAGLMCLNAARLPGRTDAQGNLIPLAEQDRALWDRKLIAKGVKFLELSAAGADISEYHIEAAIAAIHASALNMAKTDWRSIVGLYDLLMAQHPSPIVALNRAIAVAQGESAERGLEEIAAISDRERLAEYPFYFAAQGEFELSRGKRGEARKHFRTALSLARNPMERRYYEQRLTACD